MECVKDAFHIFVVSDGIVSVNLGGPWRSSARGGAGEQKLGGALKDCFLS